MPMPTNENRRELAHRTADGIEVSLFWSKPGNRVTLEVVDTRFGADFELVVDGRNALDAFRHPYAYLSDGGPRPANAALQEDRR
jgi:hypothetical protein